MGSPSTAAEFDYSDAFAAAERTLRYFVSDERPVSEPPGALLGELGRFPEAGCLPGLTPERRALPFLVRWLIEKSFASRYENPSDMLEWSLMARLAAESCSAEIAGNGAKLADLRARAESQLANALRVLGRSDEAETAMSSALELLSRGSGDPELRGQVLEKAASLLILQGCAAAAVDRLDEASRIFRALGMKHAGARVEILRSIACQAAGEFDREAHLLERAATAIDPLEDPYLPFLLRNNLVRTQLDLGKPQRALAALVSAQDFAGAGEPGDTLWLRLHWNEGMLLVALGRPVSAERRLVRARAGFLRHGLLHELVMVTRDLATVLRELGRWGAAEADIVSTIATVSARRSGPEVALALDQLQSGFA